MRGDEKLLGSSGTPGLGLRSVLGLRGTIRRSDAPLPEWSKIGAFLVTGTDTGVGKTLVAGGLAAALKRNGLDAGVMKPFATGARRVYGRLISQDARFLKRAAGVEDSLDLVSPICLKPPLAPSMAARVAKKAIDLGRVWRAYRILRERHDVLVVEGVGGLLVPLTSGFTVAHFARRLRLPVLIVTRPTLGTLNHTALTVHAARSFGLWVMGLVVNDAGGIRRGLAERLNPAALEEETRIPVLAEIPHLATASAVDLRHRAFDQLAHALGELATRVRPGNRERG